MAFCNDSDYVVYLALLKQFLRLQRLMTYLNYQYIADDASAVKLYAYRLNASSYQLIVSTATDVESVSKLIRAVTVAYEAYFCRKYQNRYKLFNPNLKLTRLTSESKIVRLTQALNKDRLSCNRSSREYYYSNNKVDWIDSRKIIRMAGCRSKYTRGLATLN